MRRLVVAITLALTLSGAAVLSGCARAPEPAAEQPSAPPAGAPAAPAVPPAEEAVDLSPVEEAPYVPFPRDDDGLPAEIESRLDARQPFVLLLVDTSQPVTDDHRAVVDGLLEEYRGLIGVITYDVSRFVTQGDDGVIVVDSAIRDDPVAASVARLLGADHLDVRFTPYTVIVDRAGHITWRFSGLADEKTLEREILRVTD